MILHWLWMRTITAEQLFSLYFYRAQLSDFKRGSAESTVAPESRDKIFSQGNPQEDFELPS